MKLLLNEEFYDELGRLFTVIKCKTCLECAYFYDCSPIRDMKLTIRKIEIRYKNDIFYKRKGI